MGIAQAHLVHALSYLRSQRFSGRVLCLGNQSCDFTLHGAAGFLGKMGLIDRQGDVVTLDERVTQHIQRLKSTDEVLSPFATRRARGEISCKLLFHLMGYDEVDILDCAPLAGVTIEFDLNRPDLALATDKRYRLICDCGTLEHIFNVPNALKSILDVLEPGGIIWHVLPMNGQVDHGFYQFSPTMIQHFYAANNFDILALDVMKVSQTGETRIKAYPPPPARIALSNLSGDCTYGCFAIMRKRVDSTTSVIPQQSHYAEIWDDARKASKGTAPANEKAEHGPP